MTEETEPQRAAEELEDEMYIESPIEEVTADDLPDTHEETKKAEHEANLIDRMAWEVIEGKRGRGPKRRQSLKQRYDVVMERVKEIRQNGIEKS